MPAFKSWVSSVTVKFSSIENNEKAPAHFQSVILSWVWDVSTVQWPHPFPSWVSHNIHIANINDTLKYVVTMWNWENSQFCAHPTPLTRHKGQHSYEHSDCHNPDTSLVCIWSLLLFRRHFAPLSGSQVAGVAAVASSQCHCHHCARVMDTLDTMCSVGLWTPKF